MADRFSTLPFRLFRAIELGDAAAVRRALADGADPERSPPEEFVNRPLMQLLVNMESYLRHYQFIPGADPVACCVALLEAGVTPNRKPGTLMTVSYTHLTLPTTD